MNKHEVRQILIDHYQRTGKEMPVIELIKACGKTEPAQIMDGHRRFRHFLLHQRRKTA